MADETELGNFKLETDFLLIPIMDNEFDTIDDKFWGQLVCSEITEDISQNLSKPAITDLPPPETPSAPSRFKQSTEEEINKYFGARQTESTKKNTKWGCKIFQGKTIIFLV